MTWVAKDLFFDGVTGQDATKYGSLRDNYMNLIRDRIVGKFLRVEANRLLKDNPSLNGIENLISSDLYVYSPACYKLKVQEVLNIPVN